MWPAKYCELDPDSICGRHVFHPSSSFHILVLVFVRVQPQHLYCAKLYVKDFCDEFDLLLMRLWVITDSHIIPISCIFFFCRINRAQARRLKACYLAIEIEIRFLCAATWSTDDEKIVAQLRQGGSRPVCYRQCVLTLVKWILNMPIWTVVV